MSVLRRFTILFLALGGGVAGIQQNRTIDDSSGDPDMGIAVPTYTGPWNINSKCDGCTLHPDASKTLQGTWHETAWLSESSSGSTHYTMQFNFTGIALSVYCILPPQNASLSYALTFTLDGQPLNEDFVRTSAQLTSDFQYNVSVLDISSLKNQNHTFTMALSTSTTNVVDFDYASYIYDSEGISTSDPSSTSSPSSSKSHPNLGAIIGGVLGSLLFLSACGLLVLFVRRRRAALFRERETMAQPFQTNIAQQSVYSEHSTSFSPTDTDNRSVELLRDPRHGRRLMTINDSMDRESGYIREKGPPPAYEQ